MSRFVSVDINKVQERVAAEKPKKGSSNPSVFFTPQTGTQHTLRIMPPWTDEGPNAWMPYRVFWQHWDSGPGGKGRIACPNKMSNGKERCAVCEQREALKETGSAADEEQAQKLRPSRRFFYQVIDRDDPVWTLSDDRVSDNPELVGKPKIKFMSLGYMAHKKIVDLFASAEYGDICDPVTGVDINMTRTGTGRETEYSIIPKRNSTPLYGSSGAPDETQMDNAAELMFDMDEYYLFRVPTFEDTAQFLLGEDSSGGYSNGSRALPGKSNSLEDALAGWNATVAKGSVYMTAQEIADNRVEGIMSVSQIPDCYSEQPEPDDDGCKECPVLAHCGKTFQHKHGKLYFNGPAIQVAQKFSGKSKRVSNTSSAGESSDDESIEDMVNFLKNS